MNAQLPSAGGTYEYVEDALRQVIPPTQAIARTRGLDARAAALRAKAGVTDPAPKPKRKLAAVPDSKQENSDG